MRVESDTEEYISNIPLRLACDGCGRQLGTGWYKRTVRPADQPMMIFYFHESCRRLVERELEWRLLGSPAVQEGG